MSEGRPRLVVVAALALALTVPLAAAAAVPGNFKRHENKYWRWYAPPGWTASWGFNGIDILNPVGTMYNGYGHGGVPCPSSVPAYFRGYRAYLRRNNGLYPRRLRSAHYTRVGEIQRRSSTYVFQKATFRGVRQNGTAIRGELQLDIFYTSGLCGQRSQVRSAPARGYGESLQTLRAIQRALFFKPQSPCRPRPSCAPPRR